MSSATIKLGIAGAAGRMGRAIATAAYAAGVEIGCAVENQKSPAIGKDFGEFLGGDATGIKISSEVSGDFEVLLDFTKPSATLQNLHQCLKQKRAMLIGTTGLDEKARAEIVAAGKKIPIVLAANTSIGVNVCKSLVKSAAAALDSFDIEIIEAHHRDKIDAPSGTALMLGEAAATARGKDLNKDGVFTRHGETGARKAGSIGFAVIRGGDIAGEHSIIFIGDGERVEINHKAMDRKIFAVGAIRAAIWLAKQKPGFYSMNDVLGLG